VSNESCSPNKLTKPVRKSIATSLWQRARQEVRLLQQSALGRSGVGRRVGNALLMDAASTGGTAKEEREQGIDEQDIFDRMVLCRAALTRGLFTRIVGADDPLFRPVMGTRPPALRLVRRLLTLVLPPAV
jgi:hypothetical protein